MDEWFDVLTKMDDQERCVSIAFVAGQGVVLDDDDAHGALRRALLLRATGGDPHRELTLDETSVTRLADELDSRERREQLQLGLESLRDVGAGRPQVSASITELLERPELAWHCFAAARIAAELSADD